MPLMNDRLREDEVTLFFDLVPTSDFPRVAGSCAKRGGGPRIDRHARIKIYFVLGQRRCLKSKALLIVAMTFSKVERGSGRPRSGGSVSTSKRTGFAEVFDGRIVEPK